MHRIVLLSTERSGSNLLRSLLDRHSQLAAPAAPQFLKAVLPFRDGKRPLAEPQLQRLAVLMARLTRLHPTPWQPPVDAQCALAALPATTARGHPDHGHAFFDLFDAFYREYARLVDKPGYVVKENDAMYFAEAVAARFPGTRFVHLVRDPRDVFLSFKALPGGPNLPETFTRLWNAEQNRCLESARRLDLHVVRYEDLTAEPEATLMRLAEAIGLETESGMLRAPGDGGTGAPSPYFRNLDGPVLAGNSGKFRTGLSRREIAIIEGDCGALMEGFGYTPTLPRGRRSRPLASAALRPLDRAISAAKAMTRIDRPELRLRLARIRCYRSIRRLLQAACNPPAPG